MKKKHLRIPVILIVGVVVASIFYFVFGGLLLVRYLLGGLMFATITVMLIHIVRRGTDGKGLKIF